MKRNLSILLLLVCIFTAVYVQAQPKWLGAARASVLYPNGSAFDTHGNTYAALSVANSFPNIDGHVLEAHGTGTYGDIAITSFTCEGDYRWTILIGTDNPDAVAGIATDTLGGVYIVGSLGADSVSQVYIGDDETLAPSLRKMIIVKYDTAGNFQWVRQPEPATASPLKRAAPYSLHVEPDGTLHVLSMLTADTYCDGAFTASFPDSANTYVLKYDKEGNFLDGVHLDMSNNMGSLRSFNTTPDIVYDPLYKRYYLAGLRPYITYNITIGGVPVSSMNFLAAFEETGEVAWLKQSDNPAVYTSLSGKPGIDPMGNIYATGYSYNGWEEAPDDSYGDFALHNDMGPHGFPILVKFSPSGEVLYATNASDNTDNAGYYLTVDNGVVSVAGVYAGKLQWQGKKLENNFMDLSHNQLMNVFLARFDAETGNIIGLDSIRSSVNAPDVPRYVVGDHKGNLVVGGDFADKLYVADDILIKNEGERDAFIARFGYDHCGCTVITPAFSYTIATGENLTFTYTGPAGADSILWYFGDGHSGEGNTISHNFSASGDTLIVCAVAYNHCGSSMTCMTINKGSTAISPISNNGKGVLFPNPAHSFISIKGNNLEEVCISDITGKLLMRQKISSRPTVDISGLVPGVYFARITDKKGNPAMEKFVVQ